MMILDREHGVMNYLFQYPSDPSQTYNDGKFRTINIPSRRMPALNLDDVRINESLRITLESLRLMREKTRQHDVAFYVLLIPTKELVFKDLVINSGKKIPEGYDILINNEEKFRKQTIRYLTAQGIPYIDALSGLRGCLRNGSQPYPVTADGHPNSVGYAAMARQVSAGLK
jgi:hypothetical protein